jgi:hypothetical protein
MYNHFTNDYRRPLMKGLRCRIEREKTGLDTENADFR